MGLEALEDREGWHVEDVAARVHYRGEGEDYSVEYYEPTDSVLYWHVKGDDVAVPVDRESVPDPLRQRIRADLEAAGVDPDVEARPV